MYEQAQLKGKSKEMPIHVVFLYRRIWHCALNLAKGGLVNGVDYSEDGVDAGG